MINLCFHGIGRPARELEPGEAPYWVSHELFEQVLDLVAAGGTAGRIGGRPGVALSFDDGNASDVEIALPALRERGLRAAFFVLAGRFGSAGSLREADVRTLVAEGMDVGTHGMAHVSWRGLDEERARVELVDARDRIAQAAGRPVTMAACPLGRYDRTSLRRLRALGYARVMTSDRNAARQQAWLQPRFSVRGGDDPLALARLLDAGVAPLARGLGSLKSLAKSLR